MKTNSKMNTQVRRIATISACAGAMIAFGCSSGTAEAPSAIGTGPVALPVVPGAGEVQVAPGAQVPAPGAQVPAPGAQVPAPGAQVPAPGAQVPAPGAQVPAPGAGVPAVLPPPVTPLARLTNDEYVQSLSRVLGIDADALSGSLSALPSEPLENGVRNNALNQFLTQVSVSGFETVADTAASAFLNGVNNNGQLAQRLGCADLGGDAVSACVVDFGTGLMERAFRRGPSPEYATQVQTILGKLNASIVAAGGDPAEFDFRALKARSLISYVALSPDFLLFVENGQAIAGGQTALQPAELGSRLAYFLTGAPPDDALMAAALDGTLADPAVRAAQVDRLLQSDEVRESFTKSFIGWLGVTEADEGDEDFQALTTLLRDWISSDRPLRDFYQAPVEVDEVGGGTSMQPFGVLGSQAFVAAHTDFPTPSFITRGVFLVENVLCGNLPQDIPAAAFEGEEKTELQVFEEHVKDPCASCHVIFDNYGAVFQKFEPETGLYDATISTFGTQFNLTPIGDVSGPVSNLSELGEKLAQSESAATCMAKVLYRKATRRSLDPSGADEASVKRIAQQWLTGDTTVKSLLRTLVSSEEFTRFVR